MSVLGGALRAARAVADGGRVWSEILIEDALHPRRTFDGNDVDAWDPPSSVGSCRSSADRGKPVRRRGVLPFGV
jgi:hypothetical protein